MERLNQNTFILSDSESLSIPARNTIRATVTCHGLLDLNNLMNAWESLCREVQCLAGEITFDCDSNKYLFCHVPSKGGKLKFSHSNNIDYNGYSLLDDEKTVSLLEIYYDQKYTYKISLLLRHSIGDGRFCIHIMNKLWDYYCMICKGESIEEAETIYPHSLEYILETHSYNRSSHRKIKINDSPVYFSRDKWDGCFLSKISHTHLLFDKETTNHLAAKCKHDGITLHGAIAASIILSQYSIKKDTTIFYINTIIDLRSRVVPEVLPLSGSNILGYSVSEIDMLMNDNFIDIAKLIIENLHQDIHSGSAHESGLLSKSFDDKNIVPTLLSNIGVVPVFKHTEHISFTDFTIWNEMDLSSAGSTSLLAAYGNMTFAYSFNGCLRIDIFYGCEMFPPLWADKQILAIRKTLLKYIHQ
ncbi:TPA: hypothetical protein ACHB2C_004354 [Klebsiella variicola subsp. variicola]